MRLGISIALAITAFASTACVDRSHGRPYSEVVHVWIGKSERELVAEWGEPTQILEMNGRARSLIYTMRFYTNRDNAWNYCTTEFRVDPLGQIIAAEYKSLFGKKRVMKKALRGDAA